MGTALLPLGSSLQFLFPQSREPLTLLSRGSVVLERKFSRKQILGTEGQQEPRQPQRRSRSSRAMQCLPFPTHPSCLWKCSQHQLSQVPFKLVARNASFTLALTPGRACHYKAYCAASCWRRLAISHKSHYLLLLKHAQVFYLNNLTTMIYSWRNSPSK